MLTIKYIVMYINSKIFFTTFKGYNFRIDLWDYNLKRCSKKD